MAIPFESYNRTGGKKKTRKIKSLYFTKTSQIHVEIMFHKIIK